MQPPTIPIQMDIASAQNIEKANSTIFLSLCTGAATYAKQAIHGIDWQQLLTYFRRISYYQVELNLVALTSN